MIVPAVSNAKTVLAESPAANQLFVRSGNPVELALSPLFAVTSPAPVAQAGNALNVSM